MSEWLLMGFWLVAAIVGAVGTTWGLPEDYRGVGPP